MVQQTGDNKFSTAKWIVAPTLSQGATHTTIAAAITSASSGETIFIRPGTYTENLTLKAGVNLCAFECDGSANSSSTTISTNVTIVGKLTADFTGRVAITGLMLKTNGDYLLESSSGTNKVALFNCYLNAIDFSAIHITNTNSRHYIQDCNGDLGTTGIAYFVMTAGQLAIIGGNYTNVGGSTTHSTISGGNVEIRWAKIGNSIDSSGGAGIAALYTWFNCGSQTALTCGGSQTHTIEFCKMTSTTASAVSISDNASIFNSIISSSNTNQITGAGTLTFSNLTFIDGAAATINTTTQAAKVTDLGEYKATKQPAFFVNLAASASNVTGDGTTYVIVFDTERFDQAANFDTSTGIFTAPITGRYQISFAVVLAQLGALFSDLNVQINSSNLTNIQVYRLNPGQIAQATANACPGSLLIDMDAADTVKIQVTVSGSTKTVDVVGGTAGGSFFSGYLVC